MANGHDHRRADLRINRMPAFRANHGTFRLTSFHLISAAAAEAVVGVPRGEVEARDGGIRHIARLHGTEEVDVLIFIRRYCQSFFAAAEEIVLLIHGEKIGLGSRSYELITI